MFIKPFSIGIIATCLSLMACGPAAAQFVHPGCLSTQADLVRMKAKVDAGQQPWVGGYQRLREAPYCNLNHDADPRGIVYVDSSEGQNNYIVLARDAAASYQLALRYHVSGDPAYAAKAVSILMEWANTHYKWSGNTNVSLRAGLYGSGNAADSADPDGDGWNNANEFAAGTDPSDRASLLEVAGFTFTGEDLTLAFPTVVGKSYRVEKSSSLSGGSWITVANPVAGTGAMVEITDIGARSQPQWFYRIAALP